jgi:hypothetical protein
MVVRVSLLQSLELLQLTLVEVVVLLGLVVLR